MDAADTITTIDEMRIANSLAQWMDGMINVGRGYQCVLESQITAGHARLPRRLKKATKKYMRYYKLSSMVITPQNQFVCFKKDGRLLVCHAKY